MFDLCRRTDIPTSHSGNDQQLVTLTAKPHRPRYLTSKTRGIQRIPTFHQKMFSLASEEMPKGRQPLNVMEMSASMERSKGGIARVEEEWMMEGPRIDRNWKDLKQIDKIRQIGRPSCYSLIKSAPITTASAHNPHHLIRKQKHCLFSVSKVDFTSVEQEHSRREPLSSSLEFKIREDQPESQQLSSNLYTNFMEKTKRKGQSKERLFDPRYSFETHHCNSIISTYEPQTKISTMLANKIPFIRVLPQPTRIALAGASPSSQKTRRQLQDAKSIISRDESSGRLDQIKLQESILLNRQIDMFQFITPLDQITQCEMASAVDIKTHSLVTLKIFRNQSDRHFKELQAIRILDRMQKDEKELKILKFRQIFMEQSLLQRKIIFVYEPFQCTLAQYLHFLPQKSIERHLFRETIKEELPSLIQTLHSLSLELAEDLSLEDIVMIGSEWRLHNLAKFGCHGEYNIGLQAFWDEWEE